VIERVAREPLLSLASLIVTGIEWSDELWKAESK
jgi:hypothetical protein